MLRKLRDPRPPTEKEIEEHYLNGQLPYRNWCGICVKAKGKDRNHCRDKRDERDLSEYSFDYCFPGDEMGFKWVVLVGKERRTGTWMASAIPDKGGMGHFGRDKCIEFISTRMGMVRGILL